MAALANAVMAVTAKVTVAIERAMRNLRTELITPELRPGPDRGADTLTKMGKTVKPFS